MRGKISKQVNDGINQINQKTNCVLIRSQYELMCVIHRQVVAVSLFAQFVWGRFTWDYSRTIQKLAIWYLWRMFL